MAGNKYIALVSGVFTEIAAILTSAGAGDANKIPGLDSTGRLDQSFMPVGILPESKSLVTSENLAAGDFVNVYTNGGVATARKADAANGFKCDGFVLTSSTSPAANVVYFEASNTQRSGLTPGALYYLSQTAGGIVTPAPTLTAGQISQYIGVALSVTELQFDPQQVPVTVA